MTDACRWPSATRVVIVDDDLGYAEALAELVGLSDRFEIVGVADGVRSGHDLLRKTGADVGLLDVNMDEGGGRALVRLVDGWVSPPLLVLISALPRPRDLDDRVPFVMKDELDGPRLWSMWCNR